jgi:hypothetical protein
MHFCGCTKRVRRELVVDILSVIVEVGESVFIDVPSERRKKTVLEGAICPCFSLLFRLISRDGFSH